MIHLREILEEVEERLQWCGGGRGERAREPGDSDERGHTGVCTHLKPRGAYLRAVSLTLYHSENTQRQNKHTQKSEPEIPS